MSPQIAKGLPIPPHVHGHHSLPGRWEALVERMAVGDSVPVKTNVERVALLRAFRVAKLRGTSRREGTGFRVWRTS